MLEELSAELEERLSLDSAMVSPSHLERRGGCLRPHTTRHLIHLEGLRGHVRLRGGSHAALR